uniref:Uncharacterized protein n=1 Tax=Meloidogyne enterolobii TaxID=390850 RepID=A0A6V7WGJ9_MELEN|nr:unnamed protein product [Meloidogyne enterolobii]
MCKGNYFIKLIYILLFFKKLSNKNLKRLCILKLFIKKFILKNPTQITLSFYSSSSNLSSISAKTTSLGAPKLCLSVVVPNSSSKIAKVSSSSSSSPLFSLNLEDTSDIFCRNEYLFA